MTTIVSSEDAPADTSAAVPTASNPYAGGSAVPAQTVNPYVVNTPDAAPGAPVDPYGYGHRLSELAVRAMGEGLTRFADTPGLIYNYPLHWLGKQAGVDIGQIPSVTEAYERNLAAQGAPVPATALERIGSEMISGAVGALPTLGIGTALEAVPEAQALARVLQAQPMRQVVTGALAGGASGAAQSLPLPSWAAPAAGLAVGLASGFVPGATSGFTGPAEGALVNLARDKYNIPIYPGQIGSDLGKYAYSFTGKFPGSGAVAAARRQLDAFNAAVGRTFGAVTEDGKLTPAAMTQAWDNLSQVFRGVNARTRVNVTQDFLDGLDKTEQDVLMSLPTNESAPVLRQIQAMRQQAGTGVVPKQWLNDTLGVKSALSRGASGASTAKEFFGDLRENLNDLLVANASPQDVAALQQARNGWKNMRTVERLVGQGGGDVSPGGLANAVANNKYQRTPYTGGGDLGELGQIGKRLIKPPPESGTAERGAVAGGALEAASAVTEGDVGKLAKILSLGTAMPLANRMMRVGAMGPTPPTMAEYYARMLMNPATQP